MLEALKVNVSLTTLDIRFTGIGQGLAQEASNLLERNKSMSRAVRSAVLFVIGIRRGHNLEGMGGFGHLPRDVVFMIAKRVWASRGDHAWIATF